MTEEFEKLFVHKGEEGDDDPQQWGWTLRGAPIEVEHWIKEKIEMNKRCNEACEQQVAKAVAAERIAIGNELESFVYDPDTGEDVRIDTESILKFTQFLKKGLI